MNNLLGFFFSTEVLNFLLKIFILRVKLRILAIQSHIFLFNPLDFFLSFIYFLDVGINLVIDFFILSCFLTKKLI